MKKIMNLCLMAALVCGLAQSVSSCKDDDDNNTSEQRNDDADALDTQEAMVAWRWLNALTDAETLDEGWASKTYEPVVGVASTQNELTRIIVVENIDEARLNFGSLADLTPSELTAERTVSAEGVGSMTWTPAAAGADNLAEVTVNSRLIPRLQKIIYCTQDQVGKNGSIFGTSFDDTAYYRFGDVVKDQQGYYWVCVRPSHAPNKGESHWMNIFNYRSGQPIPDANIYSKYNKKTKYNEVTILLPTGLKATREHVYNLSNLMWAMKAPGAYKTAAAENGGKGLGGFDYTYDGEKFITAVANYWEQTKVGDKTLFEVVFGCQRSAFERLTKLNIFYKGYSWVFGTTPTLWRFQSEAFQPLSQYSGKESLDEQKYSITDGFDITMAAGNPQAVASPALPRQFTNDYQGNFLVRYKTGDQLMVRGSYSRYEQLNGCEDIYTFNQRTGTQAHDPIIDEDHVEGGVALAAPELGCLIGKDSRFYKTLDACTKNGTEPVAMVVYMGSLAVEKGRNYNGLAMALKDANNILNSSQEMPWQRSDERRDYCTTATNKTAQVAYLRDGLAMTERLHQGECGENHYHEAASRAHNYNALDGYHLDEKVFSDFFLPSIGQWQLANTCLGGNWNFDGYELNSLRTRYLDAGLDELNGYGMPMGRYATCSEYDWTSIYVVRFENAQGSAMFTTAGKYDDCKVRPFVAFRYGTDAVSPIEDLPEQHLEQPAKAGYVMTANGKFYANAADARANNQSPVALVVSANIAGAGVDDSYKQKGLAIGLYDVTAPWGSEVCLTDVDRNKSLVYTDVVSDPTKLSATLNGVSMTKKLEEVIKDVKYDMPVYGGKPVFAALTAKKYYDEHYPLSFTNSGWFMPSIGQWIRAFSDNDIQFSSSGKFVDQELAVRSINAMFINAGLQEFTLITDDNYLSTTQQDKLSVWTFGEKFNTMPMDMYKQGVSQSTRLFVAFEVKK